MNSLIICLIVMFSITVIWGYLDVPNEIASKIMNFFTGGKIKRVELKKPIGCTLCMTFWSTLVILLIMSPKWCWMSLLYALGTKYTLYIIELVDRALVKLFVKLENLL